MSELWRLPQTWCWAKMGDIAEVAGGGTPSTRDPNNFIGSIPWITPADMSGYVGKFISGGARFISNQGLEESGARWLPKESVLFSSRAPIGYVAIADRPVTTNQGFKSFIPASGFDSSYIYYWLLSAKRHAEALANGTTFLEISGAKAALIPFPVAPLCEQRRIVEKLEELLSDLDAGVAELKAAQKKLEKYRQSLLKAAVDGTLTASWREAQRQAGGEPTETGARLLERILAERRMRWEAKQLAKAKEGGKAVTKVPQTSSPQHLPSTWAWTSIGECFRVSVGATPSRKEPSYWNGAVPWVSSGEVRFNRVLVTSETITEQGLFNSSTRINPKGSVLLGMIGEGKTRGQVAILGIDAANNQNCAAIWIPETDIPPEYVYYWLWSRYDDTRRGSSGNNQPALNKSIVENIPLPLPPLGEARVIVRIMVEAFSYIHDQEVVISKSLKQAAAQRQNILRAAFSGRLVPQDPNDEPAAILLERIRAERAARAAKGVPRRRGKAAATA